MGIKRIVLALAVALTTTVLRNTALAGAKE